MREPNVLVIGGTGFIGGQLLARLAADGVDTLVAARHYERAKHLSTLPYLDLELADIHDDATLRRLVAGRDAVINLVSMKTDNVVDPQTQALTAEALGIKLTSLEAAAPHYLAVPRGLDDHRAHAGR